MTEPVKEKKRKWVTQVSAMACIAILALAQKDLVVTSAAIVAIGAIAGIDIRKNGGS